jgi:hypothetical protein
MRFFSRRPPPLAADTAPALSLPPVRMGLLTKFNLLTIGLIFLTAAAITGFYVWDQWRDEKSDLRQRTATSLAMLTEMSEFGLRTSNRAYLEAILERLPPRGTRVRVIVDPKGESLPRADRRRARHGGLPAVPGASPPKAGTTTATDVTVRGRRYVIDRARRRREIATAMGLAGRRRSGGGGAGPLATRARSDLSGWG